jgi:hypothetical protein
MLAIVQDSDYYTVRQLKHKYPKLTIWWDEDDVNSEEMPSHVIMNYRLWESYSHVGLRRWDHIILDECYVEQELNADCLWVIDIDVTKLSMKKWVELFQFPKLFGVPLSDFENDDMFTMFVFYNTIYKQIYRHNLVNIELSKRFIRFTEDYPYVWVKKALRRDDLDPVDLCQHLLELESHDRFELFYHIRYFSNNLVQMVPYHELPKVESCQVRECGVCRDDECLGLVKNEACSHFLCYTCAYIVNMVHRKCPYCRVEYGQEFFRQSSENVIEPPVSWKSATTGRIRELIYLVRQLHSGGRIVISSGLSVEYLYYLKDMIHAQFPSLHIMLWEEMDMCELSDIILVCHGNLSYLRHHNNIYALISMDVDMSKCITRCMYYYFKSCKYKYVIAPPHGITQAIVENMEWYDAKELLSSLSS